MALMGVGITKALNLLGRPTVYVEYHKCDRCGIEFRLYFRSAKDLDEAKLELEEKLGKNGVKDLCFTCSDPSPSEQLLLPLSAN